MGTQMYFNIKKHNCTIYATWIYNLYFREDFPAYINKYYPEVISIRRGDSPEIYVFDFETPEDKTLFILRYMN